MLARSRYRVLQLSRPIKRLLVVIADISVCFISTWIAFALRLDTWLNFSMLQWKVFVISVAIAFPIFAHYGLYRAIFRFTGWPALLVMGKSLVIFFSAIFLLITIYGIDEVPRSIGILLPIFFILGIGLNRAIIRYIFHDLVDPKNPATLQRVLIIGVTANARELALHFLRSPDKSIHGFIEEGNTLVGNTIHGLPVFSAGNLEGIIKNERIQELYFINGEISEARHNQILQFLGSHPYIRFISQNNSNRQINFIHDISLTDYKIDDLLGRSQVVIDESLIRFNIHNNVIMVTGAGGSIGSEICKQILIHEPRTLVLVENSEHALYKINEELNVIADAEKIYTNIIPAIASVSNEWRMRELIFSWRPDVVYHAAAYKHVPLVESNPAEAILNNVQGTLICASMAIEGGVSRFILVSTDKAVRPTNIMGASKRLAEMLLQALSDSVPSCKESTLLSMVRFGNVLGSSGSVLLLFARQISNGGPITITDPKVTRYFMSIPEASRLVIQASIIGKGGDVFLLEMGDPVRIIDLAKRMIVLSGKSLRDDINPEGDIEITISGLRPGEKLYEELIIGANPMMTQHPKVMRAMENFLPWFKLEPELAQLFTACRQGNISEIKLMLSRLVDGYEPYPDIVDLTYLGNPPQAKRSQR